MMDNAKIAHDLAVAKLYGSDLNAKEMIEKYRQYYNEFISAFEKENPNVKTAKIINSPI